MEEVMSRRAAAVESDNAGNRTSSTFVALVRELRDDRGLSTGEVADLTGVRERQVQHWAAGTSAPATESLKRLLDIQYLMKELGEVYDPDGIRIWLHSRHRRLEDRRPIDVLTDGGFDVVLAEVRRLVEGND